MADRDRHELEEKLAAENRRLRESEARTAAFLEGAFDAIISIDLEGRVIEFNPAAERTFGHRRDHVLGQPLAELIVPPELRDQQERGLMHYRATGEGPVLNRRVEMPALRADGSELWVELTVIPVSIAGQPAFTAFLREVTERRRRDERRAARLAITQVLAEAASLTEAAPHILQSACESLQWDVSALWRVDHEANVLRCVEVWHRPGLAVGEFESATRNNPFASGIGLPGRVWSGGKSAWIADVARDANFPRAEVAAREGLHAAFAFPILLGPECLGVVEFFSHQIREPDPDLLEMVTTIGGQIGQFIERQRAESALRDSEQRFARFMQHLPGLAWIKDVEGRYVYANDAAVKVFRRTRAELYGRTDAEVFSEDVARQFADNDRRALEQSTGMQIIETLEHDDGVVHHSIVSKFPIPGPDGLPLLVGGMAVDITDRMRAEQALKAEAQHKDEFLAMLAHELRNPLAPIRNALHIIKQPNLTPAVLEQMRHLAERQVQHMARLLDDLLDVSRISRGRIDLRCEAVEVGALVTRAVEAVQPLVDARRHQLTVSLFTGPVRVRGDVTRLEQVLSNLLNNACKYTDPGGKIELLVQGEDDQVVLRVRDTGIGIAPEMLPRIFELFVQAERRLERSQGGIGIGLTLVRKLVELHGGRIDATSAGLGKGSEFVVRLPQAVTT